MPPLPLDVPPGILKVDSPNAGGGRFVDGDKIRFIKGKAEKWAGWNKLLDTAVSGVARGAASWVNSGGDTNAAIGTHLKLYAVTGNDTLSDITPVRSTVTLSANPFATTNGSKTVTVTHASHGADDQDFVTFSGASAVAGITISGEYQLTKVNANSYTIQHSVAANSATSGGGASVQAVYQINVGTADEVIGTGYGAGTYSGGTYGTPRTGGIAIELRTWSVGGYGTNLLASPSGGGLYLWEEGVSDTATVVSGAPTYIRAMFVTGERFIFALGVDPSTPMKLKWPDQDDPTDWTPTVSNTANERTLQYGSKLMAGTMLGDGINLVWSDTGVYLFQYTGSDSIYDSRLAGTSCGLVAKLAFCRVGGRAFWMSGHHFHMYANGVDFVPNQEDIREWWFQNVDAAYIGKTWARYDSKHNQVRFHAVSTGSATGEPDIYVDVNLDDFAWTHGTLDRTTGTAFRESDASSLLVSSDGYIYSHDEGLDDDGVAMKSFIRYGLYAITNGAVNVDVVGVIPDFARQVGDIEFQIFTKDRPNSQAFFDTQTVTISDDEVLGDCRVSGRHFSMIVTSNSLGGDFRLGVVGLELGPGQSAGERR